MLVSGVRRCGFHCGGFLYAGKWRPQVRLPLRGRCPRRRILRPQNSSAVPPYFIERNSEKDTYYFVISALFIG